MSACEYRPADSDDAAFLVPLVAESSAGVWPAIWAALAHKGESAASAGARYLADRSNDLSIANTALATAYGRRARVSSAGNSQSTAASAVERTATIPGT